MANRISRRRFLRGAAATGGVLLGGDLLAACGSSSNAQTGTQAVVGKPKRGGVLRIGQSAGDLNDTLDAHRAVELADYSRIRQLYDCLADHDHQFNLVNALGVEWIPSPDRREMIVKLRPDVTFHNGKPLTADDVVFSYHRLMNPNIAPEIAGVFTPVVASVESAGRLSVRFTFKYPFNHLMGFASQTTEVPIVPIGYNPHRPVGTGPFVYKSFTPGQQSVFTRNPNYWGSSVGFLGSDGPYIDEVVIIDIADDTARLNALTSGAVDAIDSVPFALVPTVRANPNLEILDSKTINTYPITMRVDKPPFTDARVRQAFRLMADRPAIVSNAYGGFAQVGNDLYAPIDPLYAHDIPQRTQDIEQAKFLLKQAGQEGVTVNLVTTDIEGGLVQACVVFAEQAKAAGANVQVTKLDVTTFYNSQFIERTFSVDTWSNTDYITMTAYSQIPTAPVNETHYNDPQFNKWYYELIGAKTEALQQEIAHEMQEQLWREGGYIIPAVNNVVDGYSKKVTGFVPDACGFNLTNWEYKNVWFT
jgi:peptide/nickel transport system substrate-binding protein